jgi:hypothetical protein
MAKKSSKTLKRPAKFLSWQMLAFILVFGAIGGFIIWKSFAATTYTLALDQANPRHGDTITFTGTFPQDAFKQAHNPQFHQNPYLSLLCTHDSTRVLANSTSFVKGAKNLDGSFNGTSYPMSLTSNGGNDINWPDGMDANCSASAGYWTYSNKTGAVYNGVSSVMFYVAP